MLKPNNIGQVPKIVCLSTMLKRFPVLSSCRSELTLARSQLANCETELLQCRQRIRLLLEEMAEERRARVLVEEREREELATHISAVQQQIREKEQEADGQVGSRGPPCKENCGSASPFVLLLKSHCKR